MKICPTCGQPLPERRGRICGDCGQRIRRHDRWEFRGSRCVHVDCERPGRLPMKEAPPQLEISPEVEA